MIKIAKEIDKKRIKELRNKIHDKLYLKYAINQIAQTLTHELFEQEEEDK